MRAVSLSIKEKSQSALNNVHQTVGIILSLTFFADNVYNKLWVIVPVILVLAIAVFIMWWWSSRRRKQCMLKTIKGHIENVVNQ